MVETVLGLLDSLGLDPGRVAVELDGLILKKPEWPRLSLQPDARLEVVHFCWRRLESGGKRVPHGETTP